MSCICYNITCTDAQVAHLPLRSYCTHFCGYAPVAKVQIESIRMGQQSVSNIFDQTMAELYILALSTCVPVVKISSDIYQ